MIVTYDQRRPLCLLVEHGDDAGRQFTDASYIEPVTGPACGGSGDRDQVDADARNPARGAARDRPARQRRFARTVMLRHCRRSGGDPIG